MVNIKSNDKKKKHLFLFFFSADKLLIAIII